MLRITLWGGAIALLMIVVVWLLETNPRIPINEPLASSVATKTEPGVVTTTPQPALEQTSQEILGKVDAILTKAPPSPAPAVAQTPTADECSDISFTAEVNNLKAAECVDSWMPTLLKSAWAFIELSKFRILAAIVVFVVFALLGFGVLSSFGVFIIILLVGTSWAPSLLDALYKLGFTSDLLAPAKVPGNILAHFIAGAAVVLTIAAIFAPLFRRFRSAVVLGIAAAFFWSWASGLATDNVVKWTNQVAYDLFHSTSAQAQTYTPPTKVARTADNYRVECAGDAQHVVLTSEWKDLAQGGRLHIAWQQEAGACVDVGGKYDKPFTDCGGDHNLDGLAKTYFRASEGQGEVEMCYTTWR